MRGRVQHGHSARRYGVEPAGGCGRGPARPAAPHHTRGPPGRPASRDRGAGQTPGSKALNAPVGHAARGEPQHPPRGHAQLSTRTSGRPLRENPPGGALKRLWIGDRRTCSPSAGRALGEVTGCCTFRSSLRDAPGTCGPAWDLPSSPSRRRISGRTSPLRPPPWPWPAGVRAFLCAPAPTTAGGPASGRLRPGGAVACIFLAMGACRAGDLASSGSRSLDAGRDVFRISARDGSFRRRHAARAPRARPDELSQGRGGGDGPVEGH